MTSVVILFVMLTLECFAVVIITDCVLNALVFSTSLNDFRFATNIKKRYGRTDGHIHMK